LGSWSIVKDQQEDKREEEVKKRQEDTSGNLSSALLKERTVGNVAGWGVRLYGR
jgi:hypothetical protein